MGQDDWFKAIITWEWATEWLADVGPPAIVSLEPKSAITRRMQSNIALAIAGVTCQRIPSRLPGPGFSHASRGYK